MEYLEYLADILLEHNTILMHMSALNSCTYGIEGVRECIHSLVSAWIVGHKVRRLPVKGTPWDLQAILVTFTEKLHQPLCQVDMCHLTYKSKDPFTGRISL